MRDHLALLIFALTWLMLHVDYFFTLKTHICVSFCVVVCSKWVFALSSEREHSNVRRNMFFFLWEGDIKKKTKTENNRNTLLLRGFLFSCFKKHHGSERQITSYQGIATLFFRFFRLTVVVSLVSLLNIHFFFLFFSVTSNEDDLDDEDTNEEPKTRRNLCDLNSEGTEPSPGPSASSETQPSGEGEERMDENDDKQAWPNITDLNTRLRRVITSYQRSYRKEEQKMAAAKSKVRTFLFLDYCKISPFQIISLLKTKRFHLPILMCFEAVCAFGVVQSSIVTNETKPFVSAVNCFRNYIFCSRFFQYLCVSVNVLSYILIKSYTHACACWLFR